MLSPSNTDGLITLPATLLLPSEITSYLNADSEIFSLLCKSIRWQRKQWGSSKKTHNKIIKVAINCGHKQYKLNWQVQQLLMENDELYAKQWM